MKLLTKITLDNLEAIALGATVLGTGGGGDPKLGYLMAKQAIMEHGDIDVIRVDDLDNDATVAAISGMGAPSVSQEKIANGQEFTYLVDELENLYATKLNALYPVEAGGENSMIPLIAAAQKHLPIIDGDTMGRAFPELQMVTFALYDLKPFPIILCNENLDKTIIDGQDFFEIEEKARKQTVKLGATAMVGDGVVSGSEFKLAAIKDIISFSYQIGSIILNETNPLPKLISECGASKLFAAKITDVVRKTEDGFNYGTVKLSGINECKGNEYEIMIQNENLIAYQNHQPICMVPDLITMLDFETLKPITTDALSFGQRVITICFSADSKWKTPRGIELVGPRAFGFNLDYQPYQKLLTNLKTIKEEQKNV